MLTMIKSIVARSLAHVPFPYTKNFKMARRWKREVKIQLVVVGVIEQIGDVHLLNVFVSKKHQHFSSP